VPRWAPVGLLLVIPEYSSLAQGIAAALAWLVLDTLFGSLLVRLREESVTPRLRGWPIQLLVIGILYYTFLPLVWL
jgi:Na+-translocating ferredoxin:NAD+ oxidoreductase RnfA subunit